MNSEKVERTIEKYTERLKRKRPALERVDVSYEENIRGGFFSKIEAKTKQDRLVLRSESRCPERAIKKVFDKLTRLLKKKKFRKDHRLSIKFMEAI